MDSWVGILAVAAILGGLGLTVFALMRVEGALKRADARATTDTGESAEMDARLRDLAAAQQAIAGRFVQAIHTQAATQGELQRTVAERLEALDKRLGESLKDSAAKTAETLGGLVTRLSVIDEAQKNLTNLSGQVVSLQQILTNKQARGAWGQAQMEAIIRDALPAGSYHFQAKLSNNSRPDCLIRLPGTDTAFVIDSKFPLEAFEILKNALGETEKRAAQARVRADVTKHVKDISDKYLIAGETQSPAIMFVPSESLYAEVHDTFSDLIQTAQRAQVIVVSPNILLLAINTVQTVMKDARMREQAGLIQREVGLLLRDVGRLLERVENLRKHFNQADGDLREIAISAEKISTRAERIEKVELESQQQAQASPDGKLGAPQR